MSGETLVTLSILFIAHELPAMVGRFQGELRALGLERGRFGRDLSAGDPFNYHYSYELHNATLFFPQGVSDRRYMFGQVPNRKYYFSRQTLHRGKILSDWAIEFKASTTKSGLGGTMRSFLEGSANGFVPAGPLPPQAAATLSAVKGFAAYRLRHGLRYWFVFESGSSSTPLTSEMIIDSDQWPQLKEAYPLTEEEARVLAHKL